MNPVDTIGDDAWRAAYGEARVAWPGVTLAFDRFLAHVRQVGGEGPSPAHAADLLLAAACAAGEAPAIAHLEQRCLAPLRPVIARYQSSPDFVDEVLQELRTKLLTGEAPRIARYGGRGPLAAWVRVAASRTAIDLLRAGDEGTRAEDSGSETLANADLGPEVQLLREVYRDAFQEALATALGALNPQDRNLLRRHLVDRMTLEEMAGPYGVHPATVARRLQALREEIAETVRTRLAARHHEQGGASSLESLARAIRSELYVSLSPLLVTRGPDKNDPRQG